MAPRGAICTSSRPQPQQKPPPRQRIVAELHRRQQAHPVRVGSTTCSGVWFAGACSACLGEARAGSPPSRGRRGWGGVLPGTSRALGRSWRDCTVIPAQAGIQWVEGGGVFEGAVGAGGRPFLDSRLRGNDGGGPAGTRSRHVGRQTDGAGSPPSRGRRGRRFRL